MEGGMNTSAFRPCGQHWVQGRTCGVRGSLGRKDSQAVASSPRTGEGQRGLFSGAGPGVPLEHFMSDEGMRWEPRAWASCPLSWQEEWIKSTGTPTSLRLLERSFCVRRQLT